MNATTNSLLVPGAWLKACGMGNEDRIFPVIKVSYLNGYRIAIVDNNGEKWTVIVELRNAKFV